MAYTEIVKAFADNGFAVSPAAISLLSSYENRSDIIQRVVPSLGMSVIVVGCEHITPYLGDVKKEGNKINNGIVDTISSASIVTNTVKSSLQYNPPTNYAPLLVSQRDEVKPCLLYTSDAADEEDSVDLGGRRIIK